MFNCSGSNERDGRRKFTSHPQIIHNIVNKQGTIINDSYVFIELVESSSLHLSVGQTDLVWLSDLFKVIPTSGENVSNVGGLTSYPSFFLFFIIKASVN